MHRLSSTPDWRGQHLIDGQWQAGSGDNFEDRNPSRAEEMLGRYPRGTAADVDAAVAAARSAFPRWRRTSRIHRGELFDHLARLIQRDLDDLAAVMAARMASY